MGFRISYAGDTHVGMKRTHNEDSLQLMPEHRLFMVADGMGGHASGEVASRMAVDTISHFFRANLEDTEITWPYKGDKNRPFECNLIDVGVKLANARIFETSQNDSRYRGMGTTVVAILFGKNEAYVGHVGDSRVYRLRRGQLEQLTEDHSLLNDYIKAHNLTQEEIAAFPHKNVIVRALGMKENVEVDIRVDKPEPGDVFLLCSDGLSGMVSDRDIAQILDNYRDDLEAAVKALIERANQAGGTDNVTVALARVDAAAGEPENNPDRTVVTSAY
ncbi:MAG: Protein phosphatase PrpC [Myxococcota bacterium]|nr:Protein phosphatase PrpC [Myxococcota bacterium]